MHSSPHSRERCVLAIDLGKGCQRWQTNFQQQHVNVRPNAEFPSIFLTLPNCFLSGFSSPHRRASLISCAKCSKQREGVYSMTWKTFVTAKPFLNTTAKEELRVVFFQQSNSQSSSVLFFSATLVPMQILSWHPKRLQDQYQHFKKLVSFQKNSLSNAQAHAVNILPCQISRQRVQRQ